MPTLRRDGAAPRPAPLHDAPRATPISPASFRDVFDSLAPDPAEMKWASIPWQTDLWAARQLAAAQDKPIFAWMMNGKPLCQIPTELG